MPSHSYQLPASQLYRLNAGRHARRILGLKITPRPSVHRHTIKIYSQFNQLRFDASHSTRITRISRSGSFCHYTAHARLQDQSSIPSHFSSLNLFIDFILIFCHFLDFIFHSCRDVYSIFASTLHYFHSACHIYAIRGLIIY